MAMEAGSAIIFSHMHWWLMGSHETEGFKRCFSKGAVVCLLRTLRGCVSFGVLLGTGRPDLARFFFFLVFRLVL